MDDEGFGPGVKMSGKMRITLPNDDADFSDAPVSIGEAKAERSRDAADWSPRAALVQLLRQIDRGELNPKAMVICFCEEFDGSSTLTNFCAATPNLIVALGLLENVKIMMVRTD